MPIETAGRVTRDTRKNLIDGLRAKPMPASVVDPILAQAVRLTERLVTTYDSEIAQGEVGTGGSGRASESAILGSRPPTTLLYGRVQSGKTAAMILTSALCFDNGFRVVVVLTADNVALVAQTAARFKALDGPRVFSTVTEDEYEWEGQEEELAEDIATDGLVLVCAKDAIHLPRVIRFLQQLDAPSYPAIVFDDEADAATPDTTLAARSSGRQSAPEIPSTIHRRVIQNPADEEKGESVREILPHSLYVQVTATPFLLFLQRQSSRIRPGSTFLLEPGENYCGGETFFATFDSTALQPAPPIVLVPDAEPQAFTRRRVPEGLAASVNFFVVAAAARVAQGGAWPADGFKHLSHTSQLINQHDRVANRISVHVRSLRRQLRDRLESAEQIFADAYVELQRTLPDAPPLPSLAASIYDALRQADVIRVNSNTDVPQYGPRINFLIGGNILGRGLTIEDLLVTYYIREAQISQMDTVWQHARMYGYRGALLKHTRVYLPARLATRFKEIHEAEEELRHLLGGERAGDTVVPIRVAAGSRVTRPNATEPGLLEFYSARLKQIAPVFVEEDAEAASQIRDMLLRLGVPLDADERNARTNPVPLDALFSLVDLVPIRDGDPGRWSRAAIGAIIESFRGKYGEGGPVYVRRLTEEPPVGGWPRGRLSGPEVEIIQTSAAGVPALALMYFGEAAQPRWWYPTLVLPRDRANYIVNVS